MTTTVTGRPKSKKCFLKMETTKMITVTQITPTALPSSVMALNGMSIAGARFLKKVKTALSISGIASVKATKRPAEKGMSNKRDQKLNFFIKTPYIKQLPHKDVRQ